MPYWGQEGIVEVQVDGDMVMRQLRRIARR
jgi:hypothetical protein